MIHILKLRTMKIVTKSIMKIITKNLSNSYNKNALKSVVGTGLLFKLELRDSLCDDFRDDFLPIELSPRFLKFSFNPAMPCDATLVVQVSDAC